MKPEQIHIAKKAAAQKAVSFIKDDMIVGLGTGSTARIAIDLIGELVKDGLNIRGVATSHATEKQALGYGIPLLSEFEYIDVTIDGADESDFLGNLIKGGGGALTREKIVASASHVEIIVIDETKRVEMLGKFPLPVEVLPFGLRYVLKELGTFSCKAELRLSKSLSPFITDNNNYIIDCYFNKIEYPEKLSERINAISGVIDNGLFVGLTNILIVGLPSGKTNYIELK